MLATDTAYATADDQQDKFPEFKLQIDLPGGLYDDVTLVASAVKVDVSLSTDVPDQTREDEGLAAAQATFTLAGLVDRTDETKTAAWLFGRYSTTSPLYRSDAFKVPVTIDRGLYTATSAGAPDMVRKFTGFVDSYIENDDGSVDFTCIDNRTLLRGSVELTPVVTAAPFNAGLTSEYAIDAVLRAGSGGAVSSWPAQRANCILAAGMRTSLWPEIGALDITNYQLPPVFGRTAFGSAVYSQNENDYAPDGYWPSIRYETASYAHDDVFIEAQITDVPTGTDTTANALQLQLLNNSGSPIDFATLMINSSGLATVLQYGSGGAGTDIERAVWTTPVAAGTHYVSTHIHWPIGSTAATVTMTLDGVTHAPYSLTMSAARTDLWNVFQFYTDTDSGVKVGGLQVTTETAPASNGAFVAGAVLDPSLNPLQLMPAVSGDPWQVLQQIAAAEFGICRFDESGVFRFTNRNNVRSAASVKTITSSTSLKGLGISSDYASVINRAQVGYTTYAFPAAAVDGVHARAPRRGCRRTHPRR
jgi:hypothetical protein